MLLSREDALQGSTLLAVRLHDIKQQEQHSIMPRTDEAEAFFHAVYSAIQEIPYGKVTSYGHIARLIGTRKSSSVSYPPKFL